MTPSDKATVNAFIQKIKKVTQQKQLDLSKAEDLSVGIMNLISIEEHLFFTSQKTGKKTYLPLLNEVRVMRTELLKEIIKDYEGEVWCISKHLLAASMRLMEVGTKELKQAEGAELAEAEKHSDKAWDLFAKSYHLYSLLWGLNLNIINPKTLAEPSIDKLDSLIKSSLSSRARLDRGAGPDSRGTPPHRQTSPFFHQAWPHR